MLNSFPKKSLALEYKLSSGETRNFGTWFVYSRNTHILSNILSSLYKICMFFCQSLTDSDTESEPSACAINHHKSGG